MSRATRGGGATAAFVTSFTVENHLDRDIWITPIGAEVGDQLDNLVFDGFIAFTRDPWYDQLPRYCRAMLARLGSASANPTKDAQAAEPIDALLADFDDLCEAQPPGRLPDVVDDIGFLIEELRVQTFAQTLGTSVTVSPKRIRKAMADATVTLTPTDATSLVLGTRWRIDGGAWYIPCRRRGGWRRCLRPGPHPGRGG